MDKQKFNKSIQQGSGREGVVGGEDWLVSIKRRFGNVQFTSIVMSTFNARPRNEKLLFKTMCSALSITLLSFFLYLVLSF